MLRWATRTPTPKMLRGPEDERGHDSSKFRELSVL